MVLMILVGLAAVMVTVRDLIAGLLRLRPVPVRVRDSERSAGP
jgi:hypothetical protein